MRTQDLFSNLFLFVLIQHRIAATNRILTCGFINGRSDEFHALNSVFSYFSGSDNVTAVLKEFKISEAAALFGEASNVITLIEGGAAATSACTLSTLTGIPLIRLYGNIIGPQDQCKKSIQMSAGYKDYAHATLEILKNYGWKNVVVVYEELRVHEAGNFLTVSRKFPLIINLVQLSEGEKNEEATEPTYRVIEQVQKFDPEVIVLYLEDKNIEQILQQKPCQHEKTYIWIIQGQVPVNLTRHRDKVIALKLQLAETSPVNELKTHFGGNFTDVIEEGTVAVGYDTFQIIKKAANTWPCSSINGSDISLEDRNAIFTCMRKVIFRGMTGLVQFTEHGQRRGIELEILNLRNNSFRKVGTWNSTKGAIITGNIQHNLDSPLSKTSLVGRKLRVAVVLESPYVMERKKHSELFYEGYCIDFLKELARNLKFTYEIYTTPDGKYGAEMEDGTWNGVVGEILNKRADMALAALTMTERREKVMDFSVPFMHFNPDLLLNKASSEEELEFLQFMDPFDRQVWFANLATLVISSIAVFVINYYSPYGCKDDNGRGTSKEFSFFNSVWFALACMLQQGGDNSPKSLSGRILTGCYWFSILICVSTYTANLAAFFTMNNAVHPIQNLEDIMKSSYSVAVLNSSSMSEFFKSSDYETHKKIWLKIQSDGTLVKTIAQGVQWVREKENFALITDGPCLRKIASKPPCDLEVVPGLSTARRFALAFQSNDHHVSDFSLTILRLHENDFLASLERKWWESDSGCLVEEETSLSQKQIDLKSMVGVYGVLLVGMVIAFLTLLAEIYWKRRSKQGHSFAP